MNQKIILTIACCLLVATAFTQTKLIAHKSHSGSIQNFKKSLASDLFDIGNSNFGVAPVRIVHNAALDSLIFISDTMSIMITSDHCKDTYTDSTTFWEAGRDTVYFHPLFTKQHALDSIKVVLDEEYFFQNTANSVIFIGYDNKRNSNNMNNNN